MSGMLTDPDRPLRRSHLSDTLSVAARAQTLTALGRLQDGERKGSVIQFLYEAGLINNRPVLSLRGADLQGADLQGADLQGADLREAKLEAAKLEAADLQGAKVTKEQLDTARSLERATMPDGSVHD